MFDKKEKRIRFDKKEYSKQYYLDNKETIKNYSKNYYYGVVRDKKNIKPRPLKPTFKINEGKFEINFD